MSSPQRLRFITRFESHLAQTLPSGEPPLGRDLYAAAHHLCIESRGKRARPKLVDLFGEMVGASDAARVDVAIAAELIHSASLAHDDIIDDADERRNKPTAHTLWDATTAVLTGDLLFSRAIMRLASRPTAMASAASLIFEMSCAATEEVHARGDLGLGKAKWRAMAEGKTGALFGWCGRALAQDMGDADAASRFERAGRHLGVAFQLADDARDLVGGDGKAAFADLKNQNPSWPMFYACETDETLAAAIKAAWAQGTGEELGGRLLATGATAATLAEVKVEIDRALDALGHHLATDAGQELAAWARSLGSDLC